MIRKTAQLFDTQQQAVIGTTLGGEIVYWNEAAERLYGWAAQDVIGRDVLDVTPSPVTQEQASEIMERLRQGYTWEGDFVVQNRNGDTFRARVVNLPVRNTRGELIGIVGTSHMLGEVGTNPDGNG